MTKSVNNIHQPLPVLEDQAVAMIIESMDTCPQDWTWENDLHFQIKHVSRKIKIHFATGEARLDKPYRMDFTFINWFKLRRAFKRWKKTKGNSEKLKSEKTALVEVIDTLTCYFFQGDKHV